MGNCFRWRLTKDLKLIFRFSTFYIEKEDLFILEKKSYLKKKGFSSFTERDGFVHKVLRC